ncbi:hypothetical protein GH733_005516 [Mirounga leonina]|nr:hypothetical protein GH733_005516 [Mirounga leonina]
MWGSHHVMVHHHPVAVGTCGRRHVWPHESALAHRGCQAVVPRQPGVSGAIKLFPKGFICYFCTMLSDIIVKQTEGLFQSLIALHVGDNSAASEPCWAMRPLQLAVPCSSVTMCDRKAVIKNVNMSEEMQQDSVECATQALEKYNIEKDIVAHIKKEFDKKYNPTCTASAAADSIQVTSNMAGAHSDPSRPYPSKAGL